MSELLKKIVEVCQDSVIVPWFIIVFKGKVLHGIRVRWGDHSAYLKTGGTEWKLP